MKVTERAVLLLPTDLKHRLEIASAVERRTASVIASEAIEAYLDQKESESNTLWLQNGGLSSDEKSVELAATC